MSNFSIHLFLCWVPRSSSAWAGIHRTSRILRFELHHHLRYGELKRRLGAKSASNHLMPIDRKSWLRSRVEQGLVRGLTHAYEAVKVRPDKFLIQLRAAYDLPITGFQGVYTVDVGYLDQVAASLVRSSTKMAAVQGAGFGLGGLLTLVPDLGLLSAITMRMIQKLSLLYGFEFNTDEEMADLWIAAASAAGVDVSRELLEKEVINRFIPRVIQRIAAQASGEVVEKWAGRLIPVASSLIGAGLNYYFVRTWGRRAAAHFREKHVERRRAIPRGETYSTLPSGS